MLEYLLPHLIYVAAELPTESKWRGLVPTIDLKPQERRLFLRMWHAIARVFPESVASGFDAAIRDPRVDKILVHYADLALGYAPYWRRTKAEVFVHCHGYDTTWDLRDETPPHMRVFPTDYRSRLRSLAQRVVFIANSRQTRARLLVAGIPEDRIRLKYLGVPIVPAPRDYREGDELKVLFLGRLVPCKGPMQVIDAFDRACRRGLNGRLVIAGDGPLRAACMNAARAAQFSHKIAIIGAVTAETGEFLRGWADVFTAHSRRDPDTLQEEAFGVSVAEAMGAGLPVISASSGSMPEIIEDGVTGILVDPEDVDAHADAFLELASTEALRRTLGTAAWQKAAREFSMEGEALRLKCIMGLA